MRIVRYFNMALAFGLELAMFAAIGRWGYLQGKTTFFKYLFAAVLVIAAITLWGIFAAPKSEYRLTFLPRLVFELAMFLTAALLLYKSGQITLGVWLACLAILSVTLAFVLKQ